MWIWDILFSNLLHWVSESCCINMLSVFESCSLVIERTLDSCFLSQRPGEGVSSSICLRDVGFSYTFEFTIPRFDWPGPVSRIFLFFFAPPLNIETSGPLQNNLRMCLKNHIKKNILCSVFFVSDTNSIIVILFCPRIFYFLRAFVFTSYRFSSHKTKT